MLIFYFHSKGNAIRTANFLDLSSTDHPLFHRYEENIPKKNPSRRNYTIQYLNLFSNEITIVVPFLLAIEAPSHWSVALSPKSS
jgi:hypothetical protein